MRDRYGRFTTRERLEKEDRDLFDETMMLIEMLKSHFIPRKYR
jgi:hypothetical protein